ILNGADPLGLLRGSHSCHFQGPLKPPFFGLIPSAFLARLRVISLMPFALAALLPSSASTGPSANSSRHSQRARSDVSVGRESRRRAVVLDLAHVGGNGIDDDERCLNLVDGIAEHVEVVLESEALQLAMLE